MLASWIVFEVSTGTRRTLENTEHMENMEYHLVALHLKLSLENSGEHRTHGE